MDERPREVLVVGAGPTGLTLAAQLRALGTHVRIVDQRTRDQPSRAFVVQARTLEVLAPLGISERLIERGDPDARVRVKAGRRAATISLGGRRLPDTAYPFLLVIPQVEVERVLEEHLADRGVRVEWGTTLVSLHQDGDVVACRLRHADGQTDHTSAAFVVGCDGTRSTVRGEIGVGFPLRTYRTRLLVSDVVIAGDLEPGEVHVVVESKGAMFLFPFREGGWRLLAVLEPGDEKVPDDEIVAVVVDRSSGGGLDLRDVRWARRVELLRGQASRYRRHRVLLAGDAAHVHSPAGAQGMNSGVQDAVNLGWKLALVASGASDERLLDSYEAERVPVARWTRRVTDAGFFLEASAMWPLGWVRRTVAPSLLPFVDGGRMPTPAFRLLAGLVSRYRRSRIAEEGEPRLRNGPPAGGRLPDGEILFDGRQARLHERLRPLGFHLLVCDRDRAPRLVPFVDAIGPVPVSVHGLSGIAGPAALHDRDGDLLRRLGVAASGIYLVRPDGYIGYRCGGTEMDGLRRHLDRYRRGSR